MTDRYEARYSLIKQYMGDDFEFPKSQGPKIEPCISEEASKKYCVPVRVVPEGDSYRRTAS